MKTLCLTDLEAARYDMISLLVRPIITPEPSNFDIDERDKWYIYAQNAYGDWVHVSELSPYTVGQPILLKESWFCAATPYREFLGYKTDDNPHGRLYKLQSPMTMRPDNIRHKPILESVDVKQLSDFTVEDVYATGMTPDEFKDQWQKRYAKTPYAWDKDPYVWLYGLKKMKGRCFEYISPCRKDRKQQEIFGIAGL